MWVHLSVFVCYGDQADIDRDTAVCRDPPIHSFTADSNIWQFLSWPTLAHVIFFYENIRRSSLCIQYFDKRRAGNQTVWQCLRMSDVQPDGKLLLFSIYFFLFLSYFISFPRFFVALFRSFRPVNFPYHKWSTQLSIPTHAQLQRHRLKFIKNHLKNSYMFRFTTIFREL